MVKTARQTSSGGIVFKVENNQGSVALVARRNGAVWCLPKGLVEENETPEETAVRETREETGLEGRVLEKLGEIQYWYHSREDHMRIHKTVHFYLLQFHGGDERRHDREVDAVQWYTLEEALEKLTYENERKILEKAIPLIKEKYAAAQLQPSNVQTRIDGGP